MAASQRRLLDASSPPPSRVSELECEPGVRTVSSGSRGSSTSGERSTLRSSSPMRSSPFQRRSRSHCPDRRSLSTGPLVQKSLL
ncbi:hypothetical protein FQA47_004538 [Oryzias melastigma]|uniref:Uncharacterized protein n=1 Tax=Oryzias melastigma TaxID=30732 RepID=A0A834CBT9_ORYME|nr:hypothetical protein FQA47_004538 [Oryzias melastigma]